MKLKIILLLGMVVSSLYLGCASMSSQTDYVAVIKDQLKTTDNCDQVTVIKNNHYASGVAYVRVNACGKELAYNGTGTGALKITCTYQTQPSDFAGPGEMDGDYHDALMKRAPDEFDCPADKIFQEKHTDGSGQGTYIVHVCGKRVVYKGSGTAVYPEGCLNF